jgi:hypothetical protein
MPDNHDPKPRTIDERLDGITQTLEIIAAMQRDNERRFAENEKRFAEIAANQQRDGEHIHALVRIAELHHERLTNLEDRPRQ